MNINKNTYYFDEINLAPSSSSADRIIIKSPLIEFSDGVVNIRSEMTFQEGAETVFNNRVVFNGDVVLPKDPIFGLNLAEISDVNIANVINNQKLCYDSTSNTWINKSDVGTASFDSITTNFLESTVINISGLPDTLPLRVNTDGNIITNYIQDTDFETNTISDTKLKVISTSGKVLNTALNTSQTPSGNTLCVRNSFGDIVNGYGNMLCHNFGTLNNDDNLLINSHGNITLDINKTVSANHNNFVITGNNGGKELLKITDIGEITIPSLSTSGWISSDTNGKLVNANIETIYSGFSNWNATGIHYTITESPTRLNINSGTGYIKGKRIDWPQQSKNIIYTNTTFFAYIDTSGNLQFSTYDTVTLATYQNNIMLYEIFNYYAGSNTFLVNRENHSYEMNPAVADYLHNNIGIIIRSTGGIISKNASNTINVSTDILDDHGLYESFGNLVNPTIHVFYLNNTGTIWQYHNLNGYVIPNMYNNAGTITQSFVQYSLHLIGMTKSDGNTNEEVKIIDVLQNTLYASSQSAVTAINNGNYTLPNGSLKALEIAILGFVIINNSTLAIDRVIVQKSTINTKLIGGAITDNAYMINASVSNTLYSNTILPFSGNIISLNGNVDVENTLKANSVIPYSGNTLTMNGISSCNGSLLNKQNTDIVYAFRCGSLGIKGTTILLSMTTNGSSSGTFGSTYLLTIQDNNLDRCAMIELQGTQVTPYNASGGRRYPVKIEYSGNSIADFIYFRFSFVGYTDLFPSETVDYTFNATLLSPEIGRTIETWYVAPDGASWSNITSPTTVQVPKISMNCPLMINNIYPNNARTLSLGADSTTDVVNIFATALKFDNTTITLGQAAYNTAFYVHGVYQASSGGTNQVYVNSAGRLFSNSCSRRFKDDEQLISDEDSSLVYSLQPKSYLYNNVSNINRSYGLIAEDILSLGRPDMISVDSNGLPDGVNFQGIQMLMLKEMQRMKIEITNMKSQIESLQNTMSHVKYSSTVPTTLNNGEMVIYQNPTDTHLCVRWKNNGIIQEVDLINN